MYILVVYILEKLKFGGLRDDPPRFAMIEKNTTFISNYQYK